jgi:cytoskeleton protein RodZ
MDSRSAPLGAKLRRRRMDRGLSLEEAGEALHVPARYIHAIETDDFAALPPSVYARALIREYARYLGVDPSELPERPVPMRPQDRNPIRPALQPIERPVVVSWKAIFLLTGMAACIGVFAYLYSQYNSFAQTVEPTHGAGADLLPTPASRSIAVRITPFPTLAVEQPPTPSPTTPSPISTPVSGLVVEARLSERSWMQVWVDGQSVVAEAVPGGNVRTFTADKTVRMRVGNAGAIDVTVNGVSQGRLGTTGQAMEVSWGRD